MNTKLITALALASTAAVADVSIVLEPSAGYHAAIYERDRIGEGPSLGLTGGLRWDMGDGAHYGVDVGWRRITGLELDATMTCYVYGWGYPCGALVDIDVDTFNLSFAADKLWGDRWGLHVAIGAALTDYDGIDDKYGLHTELHGLYMFTPVAGLTFGLTTVNDFNDSVSAGGEIGLRFQF